MRLSSTRPEICEVEGCGQRVVGKNADFVYACSVHMKPEMNRPRQFFLDPVHVLIPTVQEGKLELEKSASEPSPGSLGNKAAHAEQKAQRPTRKLEVNPSPEPGNCKIMGCFRRSHSRGLCSACYMAAHSRGLLDQVGDPEKMRGRNGFFRQVEQIIRENPGITWKGIMEKTCQSKPDVGAAVGYLRQHGRVAKGAGAGDYYGQCFIAGTEPY